MMNNWMEYKRKANIKGKMNLKTKEKNATLFLFVLAGRYMMSNDQITFETVAHRLGYNKCRLIFTMPFISSG